MVQVQEWVHEIRVHEIPFGALVPHVGGWGEAGIYRAGREFNEPLIAHKAAAGLRIAFAAAVESARVVDLVEDGVGEELALTDGGVQLDLAPFEIVTIALRLRARKS